jgi:hypothetical protein
MAQLSRSSRNVLLAAFLIIFSLWIRGLVMFEDGTKCDVPSAKDASSRWLNIDAASSKSNIPQEPVHIMTTYCAEGHIEVVHTGFTVLRSILAARESGYSSDRKFVFHIVVDSYVYDVIETYKNASYRSTSHHVADRDVQIFSNM